MVVFWKIWNYVCGCLLSFCWMKFIKYKKNYLWILINVIWNNNYKFLKSVNGWLMVKRNWMVERIFGWWGCEN